jgi:hypothetical protein
VARNFNLLVLSCLISLIYSAPAFANETPTTSNDSVIYECEISLLRNLNAYTNKIVEMQKLRTQIKMTKIEIKQLNKTTNKVSEVLTFDCSKISQATWDSIKLDRQKNLNKALADFDRIYNKLISRKPVSISCYKDGVMKTISGKQPMCPKGYKKLS